MIGPVVLIEFWFYFNILLESQCAVYKGFPFFVLLFLSYFSSFVFVCFCLFFFVSSGAFLFFCFYFLGTVFLIFLVFKKFSLIFEEKVNFFLFFFEIAAQIWPSCCENARPPYYAHCFKACSLTRIRCCREILYMLIRDWSKSIGWGPEHLEMWLIKNTWPTPFLRHKNDWPTPNARLEIAWPTP